MTLTPILYEIRVEGLIDRKWSDWFDGMEITYDNGTETVVRGELPDQSALHGVLERMRDLGLSLICVRRIDRS